jgi:protein-disulfide isomerase
MNGHPTLDLVIPVGAVDHALGAPHAPITVVEYGDFECPICKQAAPGLNLLLARFPGQSRLVFRHFPLEEVHPHALLAAEAAECAGAQGKFWAMHDLLFDNQAQMRRKHLDGHAERLDLDMPRFAAEMDEHVHLQRIREHIEGGRRSHIHGTPGLFLNGRIVDASFGLQALFDAATAALARR